MHNLKTLIATLLFSIILFGCGKEENTKQKRFTNDVMLSATPVKSQGRSSLCWAYAMLATIETEHIMRGDSVNLSPAYVARMFMEEQVDKCYLSRGNKTIKLRGMMPQLIRLIQTYGLMPYDSYHSDNNLNVAQRKLRNMIMTEAARGTGIRRTREKTRELLDDRVNPLPRSVYMFSMEYTPLEFAHSVCMPDEYIGLTSFTHFPFGKRVVVDVPDNFDNYRFLNIPINDLMAIIERSVRTGHPVCWEGDTSESGFSFANGTADVKDSERSCSQELRQRQFETFRTTDDHCMSIIGIAHDEKGRKFFICKNSWGTANPYGGMMYMSFDYARLKTIAIMVNSLAYTKE